ncbi:nuclear transport factor 2 family protein [Variovorax sp. KK3]|uniref:nuclear transport factor 2 family protein n=1 Tax=Variovorax sp. KK3 TaxID=1855728 RepID=UPI00097C3B11|nr:nuclear transport factor 2 family protein [Variovorax sp. KK3]
MATQEQKNVELLRDGFERWRDSNGATAEHWLNMTADTVVWRSLGAAAAGQQCQVCSSKEQVRLYFAELAKAWAMISYTIDEYIAQGEHVVLVGNCKWRHKGTGKLSETPICNVIRMRDGQIVEFMEYYDTAAAMAAASPDARP